MRDNRLVRTRRLFNGTIDTSLHPPCKCPMKAGPSGGICSCCAGAIPTGEELVILGRVQVQS